MIRPKRAWGSKQRRRLPHGEMTSTNRSCSAKVNSVPSRSPLHRGQAIEERGPVRDYQTHMAAEHLRRPLGRWNWLRPTLIHMLSTPVIR